MNNQTRNHLNLQKHIADQDHIIRVRNAEIAALRKRAEKAEQERDEARRHECSDLDAHWRLDETLASLKEANATVASLRAENPRPLTPDAITDEMIERGFKRLAQMDNDGISLRSTWAAHQVLEAALTEPPARPEGAEEIEAYMRELVTSHPEDHYGELADHLASRGVLPPLTDKTHPEEQP